MKISNCCGIEIKNFPESDICPRCKEHCDCIEVCDECGGEGEVERNILRGEEGMMIEMDVMVVCPECEGKKTKLYE